MKLAQFIQAEMEQLLRDWEEAALEIAPKLRDKNSRALEDHARAMLEFITEDLQTPRTNRKSARNAQDKAAFPASIAAEKHGSERHNQGLSMLQMVQELRALRVRVIQDWRDAQGDLNTTDIDEILQFIEAIDQLIADSLSSYSAQKGKETRLFEAMLKVSPDPSAIFDPEGRLLTLNIPMADLASTSVREAIGKTPLELGLGFATDLEDAITETIVTGQFQRREFHCLSHSGLGRYFDSQLVPVCNDQNKVEAVLKTSRDITERKQTEDETWRNANFDSLTGLPNRRLFLDRLQQNLLEAERRHSSFALLFVDLDRFKQANDQLGHEAGDRLLAQVAERISTNVRAMDTVARLGGDEFTLILKETGREGAKDAANTLLTSLEQAFTVDFHRVNISGSVGLTVFPDDGKDLDQLVHNADQAMYAAKTHGGHQVQVYQSWMSQSESEHVRLSQELEDALRENQLEVYYQPIIDIRTGAISGAEALVRWNHPDKGLLTPDAFLSVIEQSAMTDSVAAYVLEQAMICQFQWRDLNDQPFPVSINESPASFVTRSLVERWRARLTQIGFDEGWITMELTPASFNNIRASGFSPVRSLGLPGSRLKLAIDDFGIEPFSLGALQEFKLESIKLDRELIKDAGLGGDADRILKATIAMAHAIDVRVVGVGVETDEQLQFLSQAGCDYAQGFLFSHPLRKDDFEGLLSRDRQKKLS